MADDNVPSPGENHPEDPTRRHETDGTPLPTDPFDAPRPHRLPPRFFPGYEILGEASRGGQGVVYKAVQDGTRRRVAIKVMREGPLASAVDQARFEREIRVLGSLRHRNIVTIHASGDVAGCSYYVMDYITGQSLHEWMAAGPRPVREMLELFVKICAAIEAAHTRGVIHRDLKPGNIRIDAESEPNVLDFGLAKTGLGGAGGTEAVTGTGQFLGSPAYASPEQMAGRPDEIDSRTDVYALGIMLYQMLTGQFPYPVREPFDDVRAHVRHTPPVAPRRHRRDLDHDLETIVLRCLSKERTRRYADAGALRRDVQHYLAGEPIEARRDSFAYVLRKRVRRGALQNRLVTGLLAIVASTLAGAVVYVIPERLNVIDRAYDQRVNAWLLASRSAWCEDVLVIALSDESLAAAPAIAQREHIEDVDPGNRASLRKLHGALLGRMAQAGARVVSFDGYFEREVSDFDAAFADGVHSLQDTGGRVVLGFQSSTSPNRPKISQTLLDAVDDWGWVWLARDSSDRIYGVWAALREVPGVATSPGLALATFAARQAGSDRHWKPRYFWDTAYTFLMLVCHREAADGTESWRGSDDPIYLSEIIQDRSEGAAPGVDTKGRNVAVLRVMLPSPETLAAHTIEYQKVFDMSPAELYSRFADKTILIGDTRRTRAGPADVLDRHVLPDSGGGREEAAVFYHAAAVSALGNRAFALRLGKLVAWGVRAFCAAAGAAVGGLWPIGRGRRIVAVLAATWLLIAGISAAILLRYSVVVSPTSLLLVSSLAAVSIWWIRYHRAPEGETSISRSGTGH